MSDSTRVNVIHATLEPGDARSMLASLDAPGYERERTIAYPYFSFRVSGFAPSLFGRRALSIDCLVDARTGEASTTDNYRTQSVNVAPDTLMAFAGCPRDALREARRYAAHALGRGLRTLADFDLRIENTGVIYKSFWVFRRNATRVLVDSTTGSMHLLADDPDTIGVSYEQAVT